MLLMSLRMSEDLSKEKLLPLLFPLKPTQKKQKVRKLLQLI